VLSPPTATGAHTRAPRYEIRLQGIYARAKQVVGRYEQDEAVLGLCLSVSCVKRGLCPPSTDHRQRKTNKASLGCIYTGK
jgi:hypothetical protein